MVVVGLDGTLGLQALPRLNPIGGVVALVVATDDVGKAQGGSGVPGGHHLAIADNQLAACQRGNEVGASAGVVANPPRGGLGGGVAGLGKGGEALALAKNHGNSKPQGGGRGEYKLRSCAE